MAASFVRKETPVPNSSPSAKRQKTGNEQTSSGSPAHTYNSDADSGDDLFEGFIPVIPETPAAPSNYETQPTQILNHTAHDLAIVSSPFMTPSKNEVQVPASSPLAGRDIESAKFTPKYTKPPPRPTHNGAGLKRSLAMSMAPAGTAYKPPNAVFAISDDDDGDDEQDGSNAPKAVVKPGSMFAGDWKRSFAPQANLQSADLRSHATSFDPHKLSPQKPSALQPVARMTGSQAYTSQEPPTTTHINIDSDGGQLIESDSSEDELAQADIRPSTFKPKSINTSFHTSREQSANSNSNTTFHSIVASAKYKPSSDSMSLNYGSMRKPMQRPAQTKPERAVPVGEDLKLEDLSDAGLRRSVTLLRQTFPGTSVLTCKNVLIRSKGSVDDAAVILASGPSPRTSEDIDSPSRPSLQTFAPRTMAKKPELPQMKRVLEAPIASLAERYSSTQTASKSSAPSTPRPKKKKLIQGRKHPSSPVTHEVSSPRVVSMSEDDTDSGLASEIPDVDPGLEKQVLIFLNTCSVEALVDLTTTSVHNAKVMVAARPFKNLDQADSVEDSAKTKAGKRSKRSPIGQKIVESALHMYLGYGAIDALVKKCGEIGRPLFEEMKTWGFDSFGAAQGGELDLTSFDEQNPSQRDSGIGSPASVDDVDDDVKSISTRKKGVNFIKKPGTMAEDFVLKDYQVVGLNWLAMMYRHKLSGILADEMGLGKTAQVIALVTHLVEIGRSGPHLVICPGSTLENWCKEIQRFSPGLTIGVYRGISKTIPWVAISTNPIVGSIREREEMAENILMDRSVHNIVITTYEMATRPQDNKFLRQLKVDVSS